MKRMIRLCRQAARRVVVVLAVASMSSTPGCEPGRSATADEVEGHPLIGTMAPDFDLPVHGGQGRISLSELRGQVVIVDFWATWCEPCRVSFPKYQALSDKYGERVVIVGVSEDDDPEGITAFASDAGASFPLVWDEEKSVAAAYRPSSMPTSYLIDESGLVRHVHLGFRHGDEQVIADQLEDLLK